jgi:hypothetical protein
MHICLLHVSMNACISMKRKNNKELFANRFYLIAYPSLFFSLMEKVTKRSRKKRYTARFFLSP